MEYSIRKIQDGDLQKLLDLYKLLHSDDKNIIEESLLRSWEQILATDRYFRYFIIEMNNIFVSSCCIAIVPNLTRGGRPYGLIENVVTHPDYQRKGLGTKIMKAAIEYARVHNCYKIMLLSNADRQGVHEFYGSIGFDMNTKKGFIMKL